MKNPFRIKGRRCCTQSQMVFKPLWTCVGAIGMRRCLRLLKSTNGAYRDTISHFYPQEPFVALTIDDGLVRGEGPNASMAPEVFALLKKYDAHATFFVCTDYVKDQEEDVRTLLESGHELGNHLESDRLNYYPKLPPQEFREELQKANAILDRLEEENGVSPKAKSRWFRAPQGLLTAKMRDVVAKEENTKHVLGDCYCDDWCFSQEVDPLFDDKNDDPKQKKQREKAMKQVAKIMLKQVKVGSVAILHMPEKGFREGGLLALEYFLQGVQARGFRCVNLSEMQKVSVLDSEDMEDTGEYVESDSEDNKPEEAGLHAESELKNNGGEDVESDSEGQEIELSKESDVGN